jgi:hypothetical protein
MPKAITIDKKELNKKETEALRAKEELYLLKFRIPLTEEENARGENINS